MNGMRFTGIGQKLSYFVAEPAGEQEQNRLSLGLLASPFKLERGEKVPLS